LTGESRSANIESVTDSIVYEISKDSFKPILNENKNLAEQLSMIIAKRNLDKENVKNMNASDLKENQKNIAAQILSGIKSFFSDVFS